MTITAEKRGSTVQKAPISLTAITGEDLQEKGIASIKDLVREVQGVAMKSGGPGQTEFTIRGLSSSAGVAPTVGFYLSFLGGGCTLLSQAVRQVVEVGWSDMLVHYRSLRLKVEGLGPATVGIDSHGRSLYAEEQQFARERISELMAQLDAARARPGQGGEQGLAGMDETG